MPTITAPITGLVWEVLVAENDAVTVVAVFIITTQVPVPAQPPPLQPVNVEPALAAAVSVTVAPWP